MGTPKTEATPAMLTSIQPQTPSASANAVADDANARDAEHDVSGAFAACFAGMMAPVQLRAARVGEGPAPDRIDSDAGLDPAGGVATGLPFGTTEVADPIDGEAQAETAAPMPAGPGRPYLAKMTAADLEGDKMPDRAPSPSQASPEIGSGEDAPEFGGGAVETANQSTSPQVKKTEDGKAVAAITDWPEASADEAAEPDPRPAPKSRTERHVCETSDPSATPEKVGETALAGSLETGATQPPAPSISTAPAGADLRHQPDISAPQNGPQDAAVSDIGRQAMQTVANAIRHLESGAVEIALSPEELGNVRLLLRDHNTATPTVALHADRADTLDLMRRHIDILAQDLRDLGYRDVSFSFGGQTHDGGASARRNAFRDDRVIPPDTPRGSVLPDPIHRNRRAPDGALDLRI